MSVLHQPLEAVRCPPCRCAMTRIVVRSWLQRCVWLRVRNVRAIDGNPRAPRAARGKRAACGAAGDGEVEGAASDVAAGAVGATCTEAVEDDAPAAAGKMRVVMDTSGAAAEGKGAPAAAGEGYCKAVDEAARDARGGGAGSAVGEGNSASERACGGAVVKSGAPPALGSEGGCAEEVVGGTEGTCGKRRRAVRSALASRPALSSRGARRLQRLRDAWRVAPVPSCRSLPTVVAGGGERCVGGRRTPRRHCGPKVYSTVVVVFVVVRPASRRSVELVGCVVKPASRTAADKGEGASVRPSAGAGEGAHTAAGAGKGGANNAAGEGEGANPAAGAGEGANPAASDGEGANAAGVRADEPSADWLSARDAVGEGTPVTVTMAGMGEGVQPARSAPHRAEGRMGDSR